MLKKCLVGRLKTEMLAPVKAPARSLSNGGAFLAPPPPPPKMLPEVTSDWIQSSSTITVIFYTRQKVRQFNQNQLYFDSHTFCSSNAFSIVLVIT